MTEICERCQERLGELLQWEREHPATAALASAPLAAEPKPAALSSDSAAQHTAARRSMPPSSPALPALAAALAPASPALFAGAQLGADEADQPLLTEEALRDLWQHAAQCPDCREALSLLRSARQVLAELPALAPPADLRSRIQAGIASSPPDTPAVQAASSNAPKVAVAASPRPWWDFWSAASASEKVTSPPLALRGRGLPRTVWAGGGALVAAFGLVLALQVQRPSQQQVTSESDYAASSAPAAPAPNTLADSAAPAKPASPAKPQPPLAQGAGRGKAAETTPKAPAAAPTPAAQASTAPEAALPEMPPVPPAPRPRVEKRRDTSTRPEALRSQAPRVEQHSDAMRADAGSAAMSAPLSQAATPPKSQSEEPEASIRIQVAPPEAPGPSTARTDSATPSGQSIQGRSIAGDATQRTAKGTPSSEQESQRTESLTLNRSGSEAGGPRGPSGLSADSDGSSRTTRRSTRLRGTTSLEAPTTQNFNTPLSATAAPPSASITAPAPVPAPATGDLGAATPAPDGAVATRAAPGAANMAQPEAGRAAAKQGKEGGSGAIRRITAEVRAARGIKRAQVEVSLAEGWLFAEGEGSRRVVWQGEVRANEPVRIPLQIKAARPDAPALAGSLALRDAAKPQTREVSRAEIVIPQPTPASKR